MAVPNTQKTNFINNVMGHTSGLLDSINGLRALKAQWSAVDLANEITQDDIDVNARLAGITVANLSAVIGTTLTAIEVLMADGHETNITRLKL